MLVCLESKETGLGHVDANFVILYLRLRVNDPEPSTRPRKWARTAGYSDYEKIIYE
jgi:hypothetical protein